MYKSVKLVPHPASHGHERTVNQLPTFWRGISEKVLGKENNN